ncbi:alpha-N-arabinofuranosidase [Catenovulum sp. 2E275]|uniref:alpha-N-arabinofuranosidase n=1 Tax=Catenovulum sp. 2E275 TaxID=2980497 RepID=UPI0021CE71B6|nr:alpha-L-arabinofuranosidase C-terminal domain-containing protein [Catenovulum sp. 2E275]MCU4676555.1 alpha-N-arabinofuranosidase [Catenovulum sp. 2E275]
MKKLALAAALSGLSFIQACSAAPNKTITVNIDASKPGAMIHKEVYGQFMEHLGRGVYEGVWVGEDSPIPNTRGIRNDVVAALKHIQVPVVRWPGGCFADEYHWRNGIGETRQPSLNVSWGQIEPNTFGTHEFMDFIEQIGAKPFVSVNVGSGTVQEAREWVQYMTTDADSPIGSERAKNGRTEPWQLDYVGIGNENWGCGGNMYAEEYANQYRKYQGYVRSSAPRGNRPQLIATGADTDDYEWTETVMKKAMMWRPGKTSPLLYNTDRPLMDGLSLHFYTLPTNDWGKKGQATGFNEDLWISTMQRALLIDELIRKHGAIMDKYDPQQKVAMVVDEWGTWYDYAPDSPGGLWQQNTLRDAMVAAVTLNIFHQHAKRVRMANIAQMINVLQAMILTDQDKILLTPTYHVFDMYKVHQDAKALPLTISANQYQHNGVSVPNVSATASVDKNGQVHISLANLNPDEAVQLSLNLTGFEQKSIKGQLLTADKMDDFNSFDNPTKVKLQSFNQASWQNGKIIIELPAKSIVSLAL